MMTYPTRLAVFAAAMACALATVPAAADPDKDESGKGRYLHDYYRGVQDRYDGKHSKAKEEYWEGNCKVERKWQGNGEYKEERKCRGAAHEEPVPGVVISLPPIVIIPADYSR